MYFHYLDYNLYHFIIDILDRTFLGMTVPTPVPSSYANPLNFLLSIGTPARWSGAVSNYINLSKSFWTFHNLPPHRYPEAGTEVTSILVNCKIQDTRLRYRATLAINIIFSFVELYILCLCLKQTLIRCISRTEFRHLTSNCKLWMHRSK